MIIYAKLSVHPSPPNKTLGTPSSQTKASSTMRINTLYCFVVLLIGYISGLRIRYRYPDGSLTEPPRTLTGSTSGSTRIQRLNNFRSQYRTPPPRSRTYTESLVALGPETTRPFDLDSLGLTTRNLQRAQTSTTRTPNRSSLYAQYGSLAQYLPLPVGEKFKSSPIRDYRSNKQPLPSGPLAPEIARMGEDVRSKVESGYYGSKPLYDFL